MNKHDKFFTSPTFFKKKKIHKSVSPKRERERKRLLIPRLNPSSIRSKGNKKKKNKIKKEERKDHHSDLTCYSHATLGIDYPPTNYRRCSIPVYTRG